MIKPKWIDDPVKGVVPICPTCDSLLRTQHHSACFAYPECTVLYCEDCSYESDPE